MDEERRRMGRNGVKSTFGYIAGYTADASALVLLSELGHG